MSAGQSAEAAAAAERHFYAGDYTSCLLVLANLRRLDEADPKVQHNSALAKFTAEGGTGTAMRNTHSRVRPRSPGADSR